MRATQEALAARVDRLSRPGLVDMHFDLLLDLHARQNRTDLLHAEHLPAFTAGSMGVLGVAIFIEDEYLPELALRVALDQLALLQAQVAGSERFALCTSYAQITRARAADKIALLLTMEGVEPIGQDLKLLRIFHALGLRSVGLTHIRRNLAGDGGAFAPAGSPRGGLSPFGKEVARECGALGMILDLAHLNSAGFEDVLALTQGPVILSHTNARKYHDLERNSSDEQARAVARRGGVIGVNALLSAARKEDATLDRYVDHIEHFIGVAGIQAVGLGFDFIDFTVTSWVQAGLPPSPLTCHVIEDLRHHGHARNLTRKLIERGFTDADIERILYGNWMAFLERALPETAR